jgi:hypothetical protein
VILSSDQNSGIICKEKNIGKDKLLYTILEFCVIQKVVGLIPIEVIGFFNWPNSSTRTMVLGSTQPLTEMSTRNLPGGKGQQAIYELIV